MLIRRVLAGSGLSRALLGWCLALVAFLLAPAALRAEEPAREFLAGMRKLGYGDVSVDYLELLQQQNAIPDELSDRFDYEMSISLQLAAKQAISTRQRDALLARSEEFLKKHLRAHPEAAGSATEIVGDTLFENALRQLSESKAVRDPEAKKKGMAEARKSLEEARGKFAGAVERSKTALATLQAAYDKAHPTDAKGRPPRRGAKEDTKDLDVLTEAQLAWLDARFKLARIDFNIAETMIDPEQKKQREALITKSNKEFERLYQENRASEVNDLIPFYAHTWQGRCEYELGHMEAALEIFDEVLARESGELDKATPDKNATAGVEPVFAEANYYYLMSLLKLKGTNEFGREATIWLTNHKTWSQYSGYQGIELELCRAELKLAEKAEGEKKKAMVADAVKRLTESAKVPSEYQAEINLLLRESRKTGGANPATIEEAIVLAEDAGTNSDWNAALAAWKVVGELAGQQKEKVKQDALKRANEGTQYAYYRLALKKLTDTYPPEEAAAKITEAFGEFDKIAHEHPDTAAGPAAAAQAIKASLMLYAAAKAAGAPDALEAALKRLDTIAQYTQTRWPDRAEADDARIALAQASLVRGDADGAIKLFDQVNPKSDRYPGAMFLSGQTHWRLYQNEKRKLPAERDAALLAKQLKLAREQLEVCRVSYESFGDLNSKGKAADANLIKQKNEALLNLGEVYIESDKPAEAIKLLDPQIKEVEKEKPKSLDNVTLRTFLADVRANLAAGQVAQAGAVATLLTDLGEDSPAVNTPLNSFVKMLFDEVKKRQVDFDKAHAGSDPLVEKTAEERLVAAKTLLGGLLERLAPRKNYQLEQKMYIAITASQIGRADIAKQLFTEVSQEAEQNPEFSRKNEAQLLRVRAELIGLLRQQGNFAQAKTEIEKLLEAKPGALPLMLERGRIMQSLAERDPTKWNDAVKTWSDISSTLRNANQKQKNQTYYDAYYESIYNTAYCLSMSGEKDKTKKAQALKVLNAVFTADGHLKTMPETYAKFEKLINQLAAAEKAPAK